MTTKLDRFTTPGANATGLASNATGLAWPASPWAKRSGLLPGKAVWRSGPLC